MAGKRLKEKRSCTAPESRVPPRVLAELWEEVVFERGASWGEVISDSMWPAIAIGDRVLVEKVPWDRIRFGDIVVFRRNGSLAVHRVLAKRNVKSRDYVLEKGDAVLKWGLVPADSIVGRVRSIRSADSRTDVTCGRGRKLQLVLGLQSWSSMQGWRLLARCLARLGQKPDRRRYAGTYRRVSSLLQVITLRMMPSSSDRQEGGHEV